MDRLIAEKETIKETEKIVETKPIPKVSIKIREKTEEKKEAQDNVPNAEVHTEYLNSFENMTVADIKRAEEKKEAEQFKIDKEVLIQDQYKQEKKQEVFQNIIEKPNYDLIEENKKLVKLEKKTQQKKKSKKKIAGIVMACTLGASALVCVANTVIIDNLNTQLIQIDETYNFNLATYLKNLYNLDTTKKSMEVIETYPEEMLEAGDLGTSTNWFDIFCNFIGRLFGG